MHSPIKFRFAFAVALSVPLTGQAQMLMPTYGAGRPPVFAGQPAPSWAGRPQPAPTQSFDSFRGLPPIAPGQSFVPQTGGLRSAPGRTSFIPTFVSGAPSVILGPVQSGFYGQAFAPLPVFATQPLVIQPVVNTSVVVVQPIVPQVNVSINAAVPIQAAIAPISGDVLVSTGEPVVPGGDRARALVGGSRAARLSRPGPVGDMIAPPETSSFRASVVQPLTSPVVGPLNSQVARNLFDGLGTVNPQQVDVQAVVRATDVLNVSQVQALTQAVKDHTQTGLIALGLAARLRQAGRLGTNETVVGFQDGTAYTAQP